MPLSAYEGSEPFYFVSYAHDDSDIVIPEMTWIAEAGLRLWYDDGIHVGSSWRQTLANSLLGSEGVIFFCTEHSTQSQHCLQEINFALDESKPIFVVQLDEAPLPPELRLALGTHQQLKRAAFDEPVYRSKLLEGLGVKDRRSPAELPEKRQEQEQEQRRTHLPVIAIGEPRNLSSDASFGFWLESFSEGIIARLTQRFLKCTLEGQGSTPDYFLSISGHAEHTGCHIRVRITDATGQIVGVWQEECTSEELSSRMDFLTISGATEVAGLVLKHEMERIQLLPEESLTAFQLVVSSLQIRSGRYQDRQEILSNLARAMELDPSLSLAPGMTAFIYGYIVVTSLSRDEPADMGRALHYAAIAQKLAINEPLVLGWCSYAYRSCGQLNAALELAERATKLAGSANGLWGVNFGPGGYGTGLYAALIEKNQPDEVIARIAKEPIANPRYLGFAYTLKGDYERALELTRRTIGHMNQNFQPWVEFANVQGHAGDMEGGERSLATAGELLPSFNPAYWRQGIRRGWGNDEAVIEAMAGGIDKILASRESQ